MVDGVPVCRSCTFLTDSFTAYLALRQQPPGELLSVFRLSPAISCIPLPGCGSACTSAAYARAHHTLHTRSTSAAVACFLATHTHTMLHLCTTSSSRLGFLVAVADRSLHLATVPCCLLSFVRFDSTPRSSTTSSTWVASKFPTPSFDHESEQHPLGYWLVYMLDWSGDQILAGAIKSLLSIVI